MNPKKPGPKKERPEFAIEKSEPEYAEEPSQDLLDLLQEYLDQDDTEITD